ncbi:UNVERIFIED_CONTAM: hypothetical protein PYX00_009427 [Menopon gallinae]|uniref:CN hydrolase domain-containing protein n=1 Tax=Menopon gallinae TaxID=328185 RepID=A0AAW2HB01_9NEOP
MDFYICVLAFACLFQFPVQAIFDGRYAVGVMQTRPKNNTQSIKDYCEAMLYCEFDDLMVYPEGTLNDLNSATYVPDPADNVTPYKNKTYENNEVMRAISEATAANYVYVVINLYERVNCTNRTTNCPPRGYFIYNTNVAFNRSGAVIARYRKYNLNGERGVDAPKTAELVTFTTDFNITFGLFTGWDILFRSPAADLVREKKVKNIIFPNSWRGELPFLTGVQLQTGWSYSMDVNLLAPGVNKPSSGYSGTGIYKRRNYSFTCMNDREKDFVLMTKLALNESRSFPAESTVKGELNLGEDPTIRSSAGVKLDMNAAWYQSNVCHGDFCCDFTLEYTALDIPNPNNYTYRAVAFRGRRKFGENVEREVAYCAVVLCTNGNCAKKPGNGIYPIHFKHMRVEAQFEGKDTLQMPTVLSWDNLDRENFLLISQYLFSFDSKKVRANTSTAYIERNYIFENAVTFGIYSISYS